MSDSKYNLSEQNIDTNAKDILAAKKAKQDEENKNRKKVQLSREYEALGTQYFYKAQEVKRLQSDIASLKREIAKIEPQLATEKSEVEKISKEISLGENTLSNIKKKAVVKNKDLSAMIEKEKAEIIKLTTELKNHDQKLRQLKSENDLNDSSSYRNKTETENKLKIFKRMLEKEQNDVKNKLEYLEAKKTHLFGIEGDVKTFLSDLNTLQRNLRLKKAELDKIK